MRSPGALFYVIDSLTANHSQLVTRSLVADVARKWPLAARLLSVAIMFLSPHCRIISNKTTSFKLDFFVSSVLIGTINAVSHCLWPKIFWGRPQSETAEEEKEQEALNLLPVLCTMYYTSCTQCVPLHLLIGRLDSGLFQKKVWKFWMDRMSNYEWSVVQAADLALIAVWSTIMIDDKYLITRLLLLSNADLDSRFLNSRSFKSLAESLATLAALDLNWVLNLNFEFRSLLIFRDWKSIL